MKIRPEIPIILCPGFSPSVTSDLAASMEIQDYVKKPIIVEELLRRIRKIFDAGAGS